MNISSKDAGAQRSPSRASRQEKPSSPHDIAGRSDKPGTKAKTQANPGNGHGQRHGNGHGHGHGSAKASAATAQSKPAPVPLTRTQRRKAAAFRTAAAVADAGQPHYGEFRYGSGVHYADPVVPPVPGTAKVKLELNTRNDPELAAFGESNSLAMTDNPWFTTLVPSAAAFGAKLAEYEGLLSDLENLRLEAKNLTEQKNRVRKEFEVMFNQRGDYVQLVSNGNADVIASAGLPIRNAPTPIGVLPAPLGLRLEGTLVSGEMQVNWNRVAGARNYALEFAMIVAGEDLVWMSTGCGKLGCLIKQLVPGKRYAFRVAAVGGGAEARGPWSPIVERMAA